ncbi:MAG: DNA polymerase thumb domain-containing protein, partial [Verrucomicrobiales bacterium]
WWLKASANCCSASPYRFASDWNKPNGQYEVRADDIPSFMHPLPVGKLWGIGPKMQAKLATMGIHTCGDLQRHAPIELARRFGSWGVELHQLSRGDDPREVRSQRIRKSLSSERTFPDNLTELTELRPILHRMLADLRADLEHHHSDRTIRSLVVKLKFADFTRTTAERAHPALDPTLVDTLLDEAWHRAQGKPVRLVGIGVRFRDPGGEQQLHLF